MTITKNEKRRENLNFENSNGKTVTDLTKKIISIFSVDKISDIKMKYDSMYKNIIKMPLQHNFKSAYELFYFSQMQIDNFKQTFFSQYSNNYHDQPSSAHRPLLRAEPSLCCLYS